MTIPLAQSHIPKIYLQFSKIQWETFFPQSKLNSYKALGFTTVEEKDLSTTALIIMCYVIVICVCLSVYICHIYINAS